MRAISIEAKSLGSARRLCNALGEFHPKLTTEDGRYVVSVDLGSRERRLVEALDAIERYVTEGGTEPAQIDVGGHRYTMHPAV